MDSVVPVVLSATYPLTNSIIWPLDNWVQMLEWYILRYSVLSHCGICHTLLGDNYTEFKGLSPEDAKTKLAQLIKDEVDLNKDGLLTEDEIRQRFHVTTKEYRKKEVMETMKQHDEGKFLHVKTKSVTKYGLKRSKIILLQMWVPWLVIKTLVTSEMTVNRLWQVNCFMR